MKPQIPQRSVLYRIANVASYLLHPAVLMLAAVLLASLYFRQTFAWAALDLGILGLGLLPGLLYIVVKTRRGEFSHYHLVVREERYFVLVLLFIGVVLSFTLYYWSGAPTPMLLSMVAGLVCGAGAIVITRFWKISLHATVAMGCAALFLPLNVGYVMAFLVAGAIVGTARIIVQHHSVAQVVGGWAYGFGLTTFVLFVLGQF